MDVDIWLGAHPAQNDTLGKYERLKRGEKPNPFIHPDGWRKFINDLDSDLQKPMAGK